MEAARSSRSSSTEMDEAKMRDVESVVDITASSEMQSSAKGENSSTCPEEKHSELQKEDSMVTALKRKIYESGLGDVRVPEMAQHMSGCRASEETESDDDDDLCSSSDEESSYNPLTSGVTPPVLPVCSNSFLSFGHKSHFVGFVIVSESLSSLHVGFSLCGRLFLPL